MNTAVVILNWNGRPLLEQFLPSVWEHSHNTATIYIADNGSTDDSLSFVRQNYPDIQIIALDRNYGFPEGYNRALQQVKADYYVLLNSDIEVTPHWISPIIDMMNADEQIAVCQPKLLSYLNKTMFEYAGAAGGFIDKYGYPFCRGRLFDTVEQDHGQYDDVCEIFWATGAAMFVRAELYHRYGGLDGRFFAHMEEIDICWRLKNDGYRVMYCPESVCYHLGGATLPKSSARKTYLNFRNNAIMLYKNLPAKQFRRIAFYRFFLDWIAALKFILGGGLNGGLAVFKAHYAFLNMRKQYDKTQRYSGNNFPHLLYRKCIVWKYYCRKIRKFKDLSTSDFV